MGDGSEKPLGTYLMLDPGAVDISDYRWAVDLADGDVKELERKNSVTIDGDRGLYHISWTVIMQSGEPRLRSNWTIV